MGFSKCEVFWIKCEFLPQRSMSLIKIVLTPPYFSGATLPSIKNHYSSVNGGRGSNNYPNNKMPTTTFTTSSSGLGDSLSRSPSAGLNGRVDWKSKYLKWIFLKRTRKPQENAKKRNWMQKSVASVIIKILKLFYI